MINIYMATPIFKCLLYIFISALTALMTDITKYSSFEEITAIKWFCLAINIILQALIAVRAFIDQAISKEQIISNDSKSN